VEAGKWLEVLSSLKTPLLYEKDELNEEERPAESALSQEGNSSLLGVGGAVLDLTCWPQRNHLC
jgi:hypothetical protein